MKTFKRYQHEKTLVFVEFANVLCALRNNHFVYTFTFTGILKPPFYLIGCHYEPYLWDNNLGTTDKAFNYYDPLINARFQIASQSTNDILGDNVELTISPSTWNQYAMQFHAGRVYDLSASPVQIMDTTLNFTFDIFFDPTIVATQLNCMQNFTLMIGTN